MFFTLELTCLLQCFVKIIALQIISIREFVLPKTNVPICFWCRSPFQPNEPVITLSNSNFLCKLLSPCSHLLFPDSRIHTCSTSNLKWPFNRPVFDVFGMRGEPGKPGVNPHFSLDTYSMKTTTEISIQPRLLKQWSTGSSSRIAHFWATPVFTFKTYILAIKLSWWIVEFSAQLSRGLPFCLF